MYCIMQYNDLYIQTRGDHNMHYVAVYGHKVMAAETSTPVQIVFNNLVGRNKLGTHTVEDEDVARANYLAWLSVDLNVYICGGTPVSLIGPDGNVQDRGVVPNGGPPVFDEILAHAPISQAMPASPAGKSKLESLLEGLRDSNLTFAERYHLLEGSRNKAADAHRAESLLMERIGGVA